MFLAIDLDYVSRGAIFPTNFVIPWKFLGPFALIFDTGNLKECRQFGRSKELIPLRAI